MGRAPCCSGEHAGLKKGPWTHEEDEKLRSFLLQHPNTSWRLVPQKAGLIRCGKSCRLRWMNYLRPDIRRGNFTQEEENLIIQLHAAVGNKWSVIAAQLPGRTDNEIKNLWNTRLRKILVLKGINPITHQPLCNPLVSDYVKQWVKSIESMLIAGLVTQSPMTSINTDTNTSNGSVSSNSSFNNLSLPSLISLPSEPLVSYEGFDQSPFLNLRSGPSIGSNSWVDENSHGGENFSDSPMLGEEHAFLTSNFGYLVDEFEVNTSKTFVEGEISALASPAPICLEEGLRYWN